MHAPGLQRKTNPAPTALAALLVANIALAFGPWFVRAAEIGPVAAGFWRIALATPILLAMAHLFGERPIRDARGLWPLLLVAGVAFAADLASWHVGIHYTTLANATLFGNSATLIYPIYGFVAARMWPSRPQAAALLLAAVGAALLMGQSAELSTTHLIGDLLCLFAGVLYAVYFIYMVRARDRMAPLSTLALSSVASLLPLLLLVVVTGESLFGGNWSVLIGLALASQVLGQGLMIYALGHVTPLLLGLALLTQPIVAATIGWFAYGERLGPLEFVGAGLVAAALVLVRSQRETPVELARDAHDIKSGEKETGHDRAS